jgi:hypothetical protein
MSVSTLFHFPLNEDLGQNIKFSDNFVKHFNNIYEGASIYKNGSFVTPLIILCTEKMYFSITAYNMVQVGILPTLNSNGFEEED